MNDHIKNKKLAHLILFILDIFCIWGVWVGYSNLSELLIKLGTRTDIISFGSRDSFYILGLGCPVLHFLVIIENFWSNIGKYKRIINYAVIVLGIVLIGIGIIGSPWIKYKIENAGYIYCRNASGISALSRTLVYTRNMDICEDLTVIHKDKTNEKHHPKR